MFALLTQQLVLILYLIFDWLCFFIHVLDTDKQRLESQHLCSSSSTTLDSDQGYHTESSVV